MEDIEKRLKQLETLIAVSGMVNSTLEPEEIRKKAIEAATRLMNAEAGSLILIEEGSGGLFFEVALGEEGEKLKEIRLSKGQGIAGWVAEKGEPLIVHDVQSDPRFYKGADEKTKFVTKNMICVPVKVKEKIFGVLEAINKRDGHFDSYDLEAFIGFANQVAIAIENANLYNELKETFYGTAEALADTIEKRDPYTGGHTRRVMDYSIAVGRYMRLSEDILEKLRLASILHDIGKIGVRDCILLKQDRLESDEIEEMNRHSKYGSEILSHIKNLHDIATGVRGHHEKYDGTGYPDGLKGDEIPLIARIIAVADTFDAMTTDRPYRKALSKERAFDELRKKTHIQFDAKIVEMFINAYDQRP